jgi:hypothetical protein
MSHWLDRVIQLLTADTADLNELARIAGYDPRTFYIGTNMDGVDISGQDVSTIQFTGFDIEKVKYDRDTRPPALEGQKAIAEVEALDSVINTVLQLAARLPKQALTILGAELEKQEQRALAARGLVRDRGAVSLPNRLAELKRHGFPHILSGSLGSVLRSIEKIVNGEATIEYVSQVLDSGIESLRELNALAKHVVYQPDVPLFADENCLQPIIDGKAIILELSWPDGRKTWRIVPSKRMDFQKGEQVAELWDFSKTWGRAWYRDPDSQEIKPAWLAAAEFVGRDSEYSD